MRLWSVAIDDDGTTWATTRRDALQVWAAGDGPIGGHLAARAPEVQTYERRASQVPIAARGARVDEIRADEGWPGVAVGQHGLLSWPAA
jgi:hypothetical protein